ncbi:MAG: ATP phosphoribosyltransferase regulatory subunit [Neomegalonema sp.]|nr:ATP phosphoribosyltransferase regulatory subunit [Neomegalonema sp.]
MSLSASLIEAALVRRAAPDYAPEDWIALNRVSSELANVFTEGGFVPIEPAVMQPADLLFELYGEEIWERAFVLEDNRSESWCLRPDYTVPVLRAHLNSDGRGKPARYGYFGPVFRRQRDDGDGYLQHVQAGVEILGEPSTPLADAEILETSLRALSLAGAQSFDTIVGDLAVVSALINAADMPESWRRRLTRRFRRPSQFASLLAFFSGDLEGEAAARIAYLKSVGGLKDNEAAAAAAKLKNAPQIGDRSAEEIIERFLRQAKDAAAHPLAEATKSALSAALSISTPLTDAPKALRKVLKSGAFNETEELNTAIEGLEARVAALKAQKVELAGLRYDADFGRNLDYYDGFVFEMQATDASGALAKLGGGGRYDQLCRLLAPEEQLTGVGAALRPEAVLKLIESEEAA